MSSTKSTAEKLVLLNVEMPLSLRRRARLMAASQDTTLRRLVCSSLEQLLASWEAATRIPAPKTAAPDPPQPVIDTVGVLRNPTAADPPFTIDGTFRDIDPDFDFSAGLP